MKKSNSLAIETCKSSPSSFYDLLTGAQQYELAFPVNVNNEGPQYDDQGKPFLVEGDKEIYVQICAVPLGGNFYRLAENSIFEPMTELKWGDEFEANEIASGCLELIKVILPKKYRHDFSVISFSMTRECSFSQKIHELGGGWETVAGGLLTVTVPVENWEKYKAFLGN